MGKTGISEHAKEVAKGSIYSLAGNISFNLISFLYVILIARAVSQDDLGLFYLSLSIITIIGIFSTLGLDVSLARYIPYFEGRNERGKIKSLLKFGYKTATAVALILIIVLWLASDDIGAFFHNAHLPEAVRMLSALVLLNAVFRINTEYLRGRADIKTMQVNLNLQNFLKLALTFAFFYLYGANAVTLAAGYLASVFLAMLFSFWNVSRRMGDLPAETDEIPAGRFWADIIPFGLMLGAIGFMGNLLISADTSLLGYFIEPSEATSIIAIFNVSVLLATLTAIFPNSIGSIFLPVTSRLYGSKNLDEMRAVTETAQRWLLFITAPVAGVLIFFSREMLSMFYGAAYAGGAFIMSVYVLGILVKCVSTMFSIILTAMREVRLQLWIIGGLGFLHIVLSALLIPIYGMNGIGIAFLAESVCVAVVFSHYSKKLLGYKFSKEFYKLLFAIAVLLLLVILLKPMASYAETLLPEYADYGIELYLSKLVYLAYLGVLTGLLFAIFMSLVLLLKCFRQEDIEIMKKVMRKARVPRLLSSGLERIMSYGIAK